MHGEVEIPCRRRLLEKRKAGAQPSAGRGPEAQASRTDERGRALACAACRHRITGGDQRIEVGGAHRHVFMNPGGFVFEIGCFASAPGCVPVGPPSEEWSWFPGHAWTTCVCGRCATHLGWEFASAGGATLFHGLVLERLCDAEE